MDYPESLEQTTQFAREALPLMAKHRIPPNPMNYAIWYEYAARRKTDLHSVLDSFLKSGDEFTSELADSLFKRHVNSCDPETIGRMGEDLRGMLAEVVSTIARLGDGAAKSSETLQEFSAKLDEGLPVSEVKKIVQDVIAEAQAMQDSGSEINQRLENTTAELETLRRDLEAMRREAATDALTGLANRRTFDGFIQNAIDEAAETGAPLSMVIGDIDHFKNMNDTHGHLVGDRVIRFVAKIMKKHVKGQDLVARYGGEEYAIVLPNTELRHAIALADRIREEIGNTPLSRTDTGENLGAITISMGAACATPGETPAELIARADGALYESKHNGRNRVTAAGDAPLKRAAGE